MRLTLVAALVLFVPSSVHAGLYYSGEVYNELPSHWRGFLLDQRMLFSIAVAPGGKDAESPARRRYREEATKLEIKARAGKLSADEIADLGALHVRLGEAGKAVALLRTAQREHPNHFRLLANLGTACQIQGDLSQALAHLQQAHRLAPGKFQQAEKYHLELVRLRLGESATSSGLDDLFGVSFQMAAGLYSPAKIAGDEWKKLPARAVPVVQQLCLWLPQDGRLLWQLAELANATGDVKTAAAIMDGCVDQFGLRAADLRRHRQVLRAAADALANVDPRGDSARTAHEGHAGV